MSLISISHTDDQKLQHIDIWPDARTQRSRI